MCIHAKECSGKLWTSAGISGQECYDLDRSFVKYRSDSYSADLLFYWLRIITLFSDSHLNFGGFDEQSLHFKSFVLNFNEVFVEANVNFA